MKTLLALGGWNEGSSRFSELVSFEDYRHNFTLSAIKHLRRYNFDGLDLDWEYPGSREGSAPEDKENYATLVRVSKSLPFLTNDLNKLTKCKDYIREPRVV